MLSLCREEARAGMICVVFLLVPCLEIFVGSRIHSEDGVRGLLCYLFMFLKRSFGIICVQVIAVSS